MPQLSTDTVVSMEIKPDYEYGDIAAPIVPLISLMQSRILYFYNDRFDQQKKTQSFNRYFPSKLVSALQMLH